MTKPSITQSQKRFSESLGALFEGAAAGPKFLFLKSSSDEGVIRNGGWNGARYAPRSLVTAFKRLTQNEVTRKWSFQEAEVSSPEEEERDFAAAQKAEAERIKELTQGKHEIICHVGGGHDHVYPLLRALSEKHEKVVVLNIDAHADTRTDDEGSSGTPFRQFAREFPGRFHLFQIGLHPFANSSSTLSQLEKGEMQCLWKNELDAPSRVSSFFERVRAIVDEETLVVFSVDADALKGTEIPGVSAVNADGLSLQDLRAYWKEYLKLRPGNTSIIGIYELNPIYDTLSMLSMRTMAAFLYEILD